MKNVPDILRQSGLRPTRQRVALAELLFARGDRHLTAERLHEEAVSNDVPVSLATVYNTLHQFTEAGLLREVLLRPDRAQWQHLPRVRHQDRNDRFTQSPGQHGGRG